MVLRNRISKKRSHRAARPLSTLLRAASLAASVVTAASIGLVASPAAAATHATYYVSPSGNDHASGHSLRHAFRHIQQCAEVMVAGDRCRIATGLYRETVTPRHSGTASAPIVYESLPGAKVTITGAEELHGWSTVTSGDLNDLAAQDPFVTDSPLSDAVQNGQVYRTSVDLGDDPTDVQIFTDSTMNLEAQWPHPGSSLLHPDTIERAGAGSSDATIKDAALTRPDGYWDGARVLTSYWYATETGTVSSSAVGSVTLDVAPPCVHTIKPGETRYSLAGQIAELSQPGEWYYDADAHQLYLDRSSSPRGHDIEAKRRTWGIDLNSASHTVVRDIGLFSTSIRIGTASTGVTLDGIDGEYLSHYTDITQGATNCGTTVNRGVADSGIIVRGTGNVVKNSRLQYSAGNGIALLGQGNTAENNVISDVDYLGTYAAGIAVQGHGQTVVHNTISDVGRSGINLQWTGGTGAGDKIAYNDISEYGNLNLDTAAIYTCCGADMNGTSIDHNLLHDATPAKGTTNSFAMAGVYADNGQSNIVIANNVGWNNPTQTVMLNGLGSGTHNVGVYNNTGGVYMMYVRGPGESTGTVVENNIGPIVGSDRATEGGMVLKNNMDSDVDPLYVNAAQHDYRLSAASPARNSAIPIAGVTDGSTDPVPSLGAYQYGAPKWSAGATLTGADGGHGHRGHHGHHGHGGGHHGHGGHDGSGGHHR